MDGVYQTTPTWPYSCMMLVMLVQQLVVCLATSAQNLRPLAVRVEH